MPQFLMWKISLSPKKVRFQSLFCISSHEKIPNLCFLAWLVVLSCMRKCTFFTSLWASLHFLTPYAMFLCTRLDTSKLIVHIFASVSWFLWSDDYFCSIYLMISNLLCNLIVVLRSLVEDTLLQSLKIVLTICCRLLYRRYTCQRIYSNPLKHRVFFTTFLHIV